MCDLIKINDSRLASEVQQRRRPGETIGCAAARDLRRFYVTIGAAVERVEKILTANEWKIVADAVSQLRGAETHVANIVDFYAQQRNLNLANLVERLRTLSDSESLAAIDCVERGAVRITSSNVVSIK